jgi:hypothetical protein
MVDNFIIMLTPTAANQLEAKMRKLSDNLIDEEEKRMTAWVDDANGILAFVSLDLLVPLFIILMRSFGLRRVFSPQLLVLLLSSSTKSCPPILAIKQ